MNGLMMISFFVFYPQTWIKKQSLQRRALSEVLPEGGRSSRRREEARQVEFVRVGQALKLDTIVKGDAPTSLANTGLFRRSVCAFT